MNAKSALKLLSVIIVLSLSLSLSACSQNGSGLDQSFIFGESSAALSGSSGAQGSQSDEAGNRHIEDLVKTMLPGAETISREILYGVLPVNKNYKPSEAHTYNDCTYVAVIDNDLNTIAKLKNVAEKYFTEAYAKKELYTVFGGEYPIYKEFGGVLCLNIDGGGAGGYSYSSDTVEFVSKKGEKYTVSAKAIDSYGTSYLATITLSMEKGSYKIEKIKYKEL